MVSLARLLMVLGWGVSLCPASFGQERCDGVVVRQATAPRARPGQELVYQISVHHSGSCQVYDLELTNYLPQDAEWLSSDPPPDETPPDGREFEDPPRVSRLRWKNRVLLSGETLETRIRIRVPEMKSGWMRNTFCLTGRNMTRKCSDVETFVRRD